MQIHENKKVLTYGKKFCLYKATGANAVQILLGIINRRCQKVQNKILKPKLVSKESSLKR